MDVPSPGRMNISHFEKDTEAESDSALCTHTSGSAAAEDWWTAEWFVTWLQLAHKQ